MNQKSIGSDKTQNLLVEFSDRGVLALTSYITEDC